MLRDDYIFSCWIYIFWVLYILNIFTFFNPKLLLIFGFTVDIIIFCLMFYYKTNFKKIIFPSIILIFIIKIIPLYTLKDYTIQTRDYYYSILLFIIYFIWLYINYKSFKKIIDTINHTLKGIIIENKPLIYFLKYYNKYILK
jgi:hypothetical protein